MFTKREIDCVTHTPRMARMFALLDVMISFRWCCVLSRYSSSNFGFWSTRSTHRDRGYSSSDGARLCGKGNKSSTVLLYKAHRSKQVLEPKSVTDCGVGKFLVNLDSPKKPL